jgi:cytochrome c oxidase subunit II
VKRAAGTALALLLSGCGVRHQSAVDAAGRQAGEIEGLFWFFIILLGAIFLTVVAFMLGPLFKRRPETEQERLEQTHTPSDETERKLTHRVGLATGITVLILLGLIVLSVSTGKSISGGNSPANALTVEVVGNQWWWYIRYLNDDASRTVVTANEMHIPIGRPIVIRGTSHDVIHSFWVPNLNGKRDLIPSHTTTEWFQVDRPGRYRGQCAEFCGLQHAHMALWVVAETPAKFNSWIDRQLRPARAPSDPMKQRGQRVFLDHACVLCHAIRGTTAAAEQAPDLTHLASRSTIAAGTLPNTRGNLAGWIADPQNIKPGNHMATVALNGEDMQPLLSYLESLE